MKCKKIISSIICVITGIFMLASCAKDSYGDQNEFPEEVDVKVSVRLPGTYSSATRTMSGDDEKDVNTIEVIVFEGGKYSYIAYGRDITAVSGNNKTFDVTLRTGVFDIMILANSREELSTCLSANAITRNSSRADVEKAIVTSVAGKWDTGTEVGSNDFRYLPMWGYLAAVTVDGNSSFRDPITLVRSLAKTEVVVDKNIYTNFKLESVRLYNYMSQGQVAPTSGNVNSASTRVTAPSVPASASKVKGPLIWDAGSITSTNGEECTNDIYMFEAPAGSRTGYLNNTCLVIGGIWEGVTYYYRIDYMTENNGTAEYLNILRNHRYLITIKKISGPGYLNPDDAFNSLPYNIDVQIEPWGEENINIVDDGQYTHSLSPVNIELWADGASDSKVKFRTTYPSWTYEKSDRDEAGHPQANPSNVSWLSVTSHIAGNTNTGGGNVDDVSFDVPGNYSGSSPRVAYLHFTAGKFRGTVAVRQYNYRIDEIDLTRHDDMETGGDTRLVQLTGIFESIDVRARELGSYTILAKATVTGNRSAGTFYAGLEIPFTVEERTISFEYLDPRYNEWLTFRTLKQLSTSGFQYETFVEGYAVDGETTPQTNFAMGVYGRFPALMYRARLENNTVLGTAQIPAGTATSGSPAYVEIKTGNAPTASRRIYFEYSANGGLSWTHIRYLTQLPQGPDFTLSIIDHTEGQAIPAEGANYTVNVTGNYPKILLRGAENGTSNVSNSTTISAGSATVTNPAKGTISVLPNTTNASRLVLLQYSTDDGVNWITVTRGNQAPMVTTSKFDVIFSYVPPAVIPADGYTYGVTVTGDYPNLVIRTFANNGSMLNQINLLAGSGPTTREIKVTPNNTNSDRTVTFQYSTDGTVWETKVSGKQPHLRPNNYILKSGLMVAMRDLPEEVNWATAMGLPQKYNSILYPELDVANYITDYSPANGGCAAYNEANHPAGTWRLPTPTELNEMLEKAGDLGMISTGTQLESSYWNIHQYSATVAYSQTYRSPQYQAYGYKTGTHHVRCVAVYYRD